MGREIFEARNEVARARSLRGVGMGSMCTLCKFARQRQQVDTLGCELPHARLAAQFLPNRLIKKMAKSKTAKRSEQGEKFNKKGPIPKESIAGRLPPITPAVALPSPSVLEGLVPDIVRVRIPDFQ